MANKVTPEVIEGLVGSILSQRYDEPVKTPQCHRNWWSMACSKHRLVGIAAPRSHAKSTAITHAYLLAKVLFRESIFALVVSDTEAQAKEFLQDIIIDLSTNEDLIALFDIDGFEKDTEAAIVVRFNDGARFKIEAKGSGQKVRGLKWNQKRPDLVIVDDAENEELVATKEQRTKLKRWFNGALIPCMANSGLLRAVGTVIHSDSWLASIMPNEQSPLTIHEPLRVYSNLPNHGWYSAKYRGHPAIGDYSQVLWPEHRPASFFMEEYARLEADGQTDVYSAEHLNNPIDETAAFFRKRDFQDLPEKLPQLNYYVGVDFAISTAQRADYTAMAVIGVDEAGNLYLVEMVRDRFTPDESAKEIFRLEKDYKPHCFFVEKGALVHAMGAAINRDMERYKCYPVFSPVPNTGDKRTKAWGIQKVMRTGHMYFDMSADWYPAFEDECLRFDRGRHDDQVDAIAIVGQRLDELLDAPTNEDVQEELWEEEFGQDVPQGRNSLTGY